MKKALVSAVSVLTLGGGAAATALPVAAEPVTQEGLVNVAITDVGVQIPVSLAANICDVNVAVLVDQLQDAPADCEADAGSEANIEFADPGGPTHQQGLVNVLLDDVFVQVPIGIAANVCDVNAGILVSDLQDATATCESDAVSVSTIS
ncbi:MAG: hypothetical protein ACRDY4_06065 [Acidimicrobiia bacterium]